MTDLPLCPVTGDDVDDCYCVDMQPICKGCGEDLIYACGDMCAWCYAEQRMSFYDERDAADERRKCEQEED